MFFLYGFQNLGKALQTISLKRNSQIRLISHWTSCRTIQGVISLKFQISLVLCARRFWNYLCDYFLNFIPLSANTITYCNSFKFEIVFCLFFFLDLRLRLAWDTFPFAQFLLVFVFLFLLFYCITYNIYLPVRPIKLIDWVLSILILGFWIFFTLSSFNLQHPGTGIDVRRRKIWDLYGENTILQVLSHCQVENNYKSAFVVHIMWSSWWG